MYLSKSLAEDGAGDDGFLPSAEEAFAHTRFYWCWCALEMNPLIDKESGYVAFCDRLKHLYCCSISIHRWKQR